MVKQLQKERRQWVRAKHVLSIQYRLAKGKQTAAHTSWSLSTTQDMSVGGLSFYTEHEFHKNDLLEVSVVMSGVLDIFKGFARVMRVIQTRPGASFLVGVKFENKGPSKRSAKTYTASSASRIRPRNRSVKRI